MGEGDYYRAITEFKRAAFLADSTDVVTHDIAVFGVGRALFSGGEYVRAGEWLFDHSAEITDERTGTESRALMLRAFLTAGRGDRVLQILGPSEDDDAERAYYRAMALANIGRWRESRDSFLAIDSESPYSAVATQHAEVADNALDANWKSPTTATVLGIVPGLGYWYAGHKQSGVAALIVTGVFTWATIEAFNSDQNVLGGFLAVFSTSWYASSIYGSFRAAHRYNGHIQAELWVQMRY